MPKPSPINELSRNELAAMQVLLTRQPLAEPFAGHLPKWLIALSPWGGKSVIVYRLPIIGKIGAWM